LIRFIPVLLLALVPLVQRQVDSRLRAFAGSDESLYLWSGAQVRRLAPGLEDLMADVYWLRTVQYFGGRTAFQANQGYPLLGPLLDITVTLDKRMEIAYRYGAVFLSQPPPRGAGRPKDAIALLERGVAAQPGNWRLRQELGFCHYLYLHDNRTAARILDRAADLPGAPFWLRTLAADVLLRGGDRATSRRIWERLYEQSEEGAIRDNAQFQLQVIDALDEADRLAGLVRVFTERMGRKPTSLDELVSAGMLRRPPRDIAGVPFEYHPDTGRVTIGRGSVLWRPQ
jgi:hypothetical protein